MTLATFAPAFATAVPLTRTEAKARAYSAHTEDDHRALPEFYRAQALRQREEAVKQ